MKKNCLILVLYSALLLVSEIFYRSVFEITPLYRYGESYLIIFIVLSLFYFAKYRISRIFIAFLFISSTLFNNLHQAVYLNWINGTNYYLMFKEWHEVMHFGMPMLFTSGILVKILWSLFDIALFLSIARFRRQTSLIADSLFYIMMIYIFVRSFSTTQEFGITSNPGYSRIKSNYFALGNCIGRVLPYEFFNLSDIPVYSAKTPEKISLPKVKNIIFIMGESASANNFSAFGYQRNTSPFLANIQNQEPSAILKQAYSAGLMTAISLPTLFNAVPKPNGQEQIITGKTNLFHLAKEAGFKTYFYSAQPEKEMMIISLMGKTWIEDLRFPTYLNKGIYDGMNDHQLLPWFKEIDLADGQHFIVLHQRGSHGVYAEHLSEEEKGFKSGSVLDDYDSTILNTDQLIEKVYRYLKAQPNQDWVLIYTSDHGQYVTDKYFNQGTSVEPNYNVPIFIYSPEKAVQQIEHQFKPCPKMYHQQVATFIIDLLGFNMPISSCQEGTINSRLLTGDAGYYEVKQGEKPNLILPKKAH